MINACPIVIFILVPCYVAQWSNVGTILFSRANLSTRNWKKTDVALLRARKYFQNILPSDNSDLANADNDYIKTVLGYFKEAYITVKNVSGDPEIDKIMTTALSDVVGGYLKLYLLPISKLFYYSGSLPYEDASKVTDLYQDIQKFLNCNGTGWREPDTRFLSNIFTKSCRRRREKLVNSCNKMKDPCSNFAYIQRDVNGKTRVPLPEINWEDETMFTPLRSEVTFSLHSPKHSNTLKRYYDCAKCCVGSIGPEAEKSFDNEFNEWLQSRVVTHLSDKKMYAALFDVLTLVNRTRDLCETLIDVYKTEQKPNSTMLLFTTEKLHDMLTSKKFIFVTVLLIIDVILCCIACRHIVDIKRDQNKRLDDDAEKSLCYPTFTKKSIRKPTVSNRNIFIHSEPGKRCNVTIPETDSNKLNCISSNNVAVATSTKEIETQTKNHAKHSSEGLCQTGSTVSIIFPIKANIGTYIDMPQKKSTYTLTHEEKKSLDFNNMREICNCAPDCAKQSLDFNNKREMCKCALNCANCSEKCKPKSSTAADLMHKIMNIETDSYHTQVHRLDSSIIFTSELDMPTRLQTQGSLIQPYCDHSRTISIGKEIESIVKKNTTEITKIDSKVNRLKTFVEIQIKRPGQIDLQSDLLKTPHIETIVKIPKLKDYEMCSLTHEGIYFTDKKCSPVHHILKDASASNLISIHHKDVCTVTSMIINPSIKIMMNPKRNTSPSMYKEQKANSKIIPLFIRNKSLSSDSTSCMNANKSTEKSFIPGKCLEKTFDQHKSSDEMCLVAAHNATTKNLASTEMVVDNASLLSPKYVKNTEQFDFVEDRISTTSFLTSKSSRDKRLKYSARKLKPQSISQAREILLKQTIPTLTKPTSTVQSNTSRNISNKLPPDSLQPLKTIVNLEEDSNKPLQNLSSALPKTILKPPKLVSKCAEISRKSFEMTPQAVFPERKPRCNFQSSHFTESSNKASEMYTANNNYSIDSKREGNLNDSLISPSAAPRRKLRYPTVFSNIRTTELPNIVSNKTLNCNKKIQSPRIYSNITGITNDDTSEVLPNPKTKIASSPERKQMSRQICLDSRKRSKKQIDIEIDLIPPVITLTSKTSNHEPKTQDIETKCIGSSHRTETTPLAYSRNITGLHATRKQLERESKYSVLSHKPSDISFKPVKITPESSKTRDDETFPERISKSLGSHFYQVSTKPRGILKMSKRTTIEESEAVEKKQNQVEIPREILKSKEAIVSASQHQNVEAEYPVSCRASPVSGKKNQFKIKKYKSPSGKDTHKTADLNDNSINVSL